MKGIAIYPALVMTALVTRDLVPVAEQLVPFKMVNVMHIKIMIKKCSRPLKICLPPILCSLVFEPDRRRGTVSWSL